MRKTPSRAWLLKPEWLLKVLLALVLGVLIISMYNAVVMAFQDDHSRSALIVVGELWVLGILSLLVFSQLLQETREEPRHLQEVFEKSASGFAIVALDGTFIAVNPALAASTGYSAEELKRRNFQAITHADDLEADLAQVQRLLEGQCSAYRLRKRYIRPDGSWMWAELRVTLVKDRDYQPLYFIAQVDPLLERGQETRPAVYPYDHSDLLYCQP